MNWGGEGMLRVLVGKSKEKRPLGRPTCRWDDDIKMDLRWGGMDWIDLAKDRDKWRALVNMVINLQVPYNVRMFLSSCTTSIFSRGTQLQDLSQFGC
jgi:hypothetical protein